MQKVAILTDSTVNLHLNVIKENNIQLVHQLVIWNNKSYLDLIDMQPADFYQRLKSDPSVPTTSQASVMEFKQVYERLIDADFEVLAMLISDQLSGTIQSAIQAKEFFPKARIEIFNTKSTSLAMGFQVLEVARAASNGAAMNDCLALAERARQNSGVVFVVDTLEFLHRGGRIGGAARFLGTALGLKPVLELQDGKIEAIERVPTQRKAVNRMVELVKTRIGGRTPVRLGILNADAEERGKHLEAHCRDIFHPIEVVSNQVSPAIGAHAGPGTLGIAYIAGM